MNEVKNTVKKAISKVYDIDFEPEISRTEEQFGDYASNAAMQLAPEVGKNPLEIAKALETEISGLGYYEKVEVAGPGFLNITLKSADIWNMAVNAANLPKPFEAQEILVEFGDPNPFKEMHIGHLYSYIVGDSISRLLEAGGATVRRLSYHGDVGRHVARAIWGMRKQGFSFNNVSDQLRVDLGRYYALGAQADEDDEQARLDIDEINDHIYSRDDQAINELYDKGKEASIGYFNSLLADIDIKDGIKLFESEAADKGIKLVLQNIGTVFKKSNGAIIYEGEKVGLHTRVFITSKNLPTYEAKDLGLTELKDERYPSASRSIIITANEQSEYFKVMLAALAEINKTLADKTVHIAHGFVSLSTGKMSSRTGNVYSGVSAIVDIARQAREKFPESTDSMRNAAVKYDFLKHKLGSDIVYDLEKSFSIEGNSGPYLQYAYARANGILQKVAASDESGELQVAERSLARKISEYPEVVTLATTELMPHYVANYLYELAQGFNRFYENNRVAGDEREGIRSNLVRAYAVVLKNGLGLLSIEAPERV